MKSEDVRNTAFAMPLCSPSYPIGPYRFVDREYMIITYRTDREALEEIVPEPLEIIEPTVKYEFIRMPHSTGFGSYAGSAQVIPVRFRRQRATIPTRCSWMPIRRSLAAASSGAFRKSSPRQT